MQFAKKCLDGKGKTEALKNEADRNLKPKGRASAVSAKHYELNGAKQAMLNRKTVLRHSKGTAHKLFRSKSKLKGFLSFFGFICLFVLSKCLQKEKESTGSRKQSQAVASSNKHPAPK